MTPTEVADAAGCKYQPHQTDELYVKEAGRCKIGGSEVTIYTFDSSSVRDGYLNIAEGFGGLYLVGETWIITGDRPALEAAQEGAGGEIS